MSYTAEGRKINYDWMPAAIANGIEWGNSRAGKPDRWDCLYRRGIANKILWHIGVVVSYFYTLR